MIWVASRAQTEIPENHTVQDGMQPSTQIYHVCARSSVNKRMYFFSGNRCIPSSKVKWQKKWLQPSPSAHFSTLLFPIVKTEHLGPWWHLPIKIISAMNAARQEKSHLPLYGNHLAGMQEAHFWQIAYPFDVRKSIPFSAPERNFTWILQVQPTFLRPLLSQPALWSLQHAFS